MRVGIIFGIIHHYELNFHPYFPAKNTARIICTLIFAWLVLQNKTPFIDQGNNVFGPISVLVCQTLAL